LLYNKFCPDFYNMKLICPECKNEVNLSKYPNLQNDQTLECDVCGITLLVTSVDGDNAQAEVADEGK